jgi:hypothetical protein
VRGHCKPTILIGLHCNPTTSPSPWFPFNGGLLVGILATFFPKTSISKHKEWSPCNCWKDRMYTSICKVINIYIYIYIYNMLYIYVYVMNANIKHHLPMDGIHP